MPKDTSIKKVLLIGSGPIVIGQAAEFDYAGTQAAKTLRDEGIEVVLVNSNPATIMTDCAMADKIYLEPLTAEVVKRIIKEEKPDSLLGTLGGQTGLNLSMQLEKEGFLKEHGVRLLGVATDTIDRAEDRQLFKDTMEKIGQPVIPSDITTTIDGALALADKLGYPVIVRPAFTLGGTGGGIAANKDELYTIAESGIAASPIHQILIEKCVSGWKEIEFEVMRDAAGNLITICSMENLDPVGIHTGDSIVAAPALTLASKEYNMLSSAALAIIDELKITGGCNVQFALDPNSFEYAVIEVNPRVSRSSALASKATGYPIAKVAAKIAIGYTLDEIPNLVTGTTMACFEPSVDYVVVKFPRWPFDKFVYANRKLGTQMKATGEVMAIGSNFEMALMKAVRGAEVGVDSLSHERYKERPDAELASLIAEQSDERIFFVYEALRRHVMTCEELHELTMIDMWFLTKIRNLAEMELRLGREELTEDLYREAKFMGFPDKTIIRMSGVDSLPWHMYASYKTVDTCAAEFRAATPYFYSSYDADDEAAPYIAEHNTSSKGTVMVVGSGPIRIGQGIEFDYASVHCVWALKKAGYDVIIVNNNPETVSTDFDTADRLYFEPLTPEDVENIIRIEKPVGAVVAFGGQTAIKLTRFIDKAGVKILGTSPDMIDCAEDRERFEELLNRFDIKRAIGETVMTCDEALDAANRIGYPVLVRPSYVLGGQNMIIAYTDADIREYMGIILAQGIENPVLIDKYLMGIELEVDAICDGEDILIPGIMEHVERTGVHSGDSIAVYPAQNVDDSMRDYIVQHTRDLALALETKGLINIQYLIYQGGLYVIEVNPRSSRTVPYISKVTGIPMVDIALRCMLGEKLKDMEFGTGLFPNTPYVAVKVPVFSFEKLSGVDTHLGPEMKSTGEVLGLAGTFDEALYKGLKAAGYKLGAKGGVFITVRDTDKSEIGGVAKKFEDLGFRIYATARTGETLRKSGVRVTTVHQPEDYGSLPGSLITDGKINYIISTSSKGRDPSRDSVKLRRLAVEHAIPCLTSLDTANAVADSIASRWNEKCTELVNINDLRTERVTLDFIKMETCGNDYIYFDCLKTHIRNPEGLSIKFVDRHYGIGGDGCVIIEPSDVADAKMRMFNRDGSEGRLCGNGARCVAKYLYDSGIVPRKNMTIETLSGICNVEVTTREGKVIRTKGDMGKVFFDQASIPAAFPACPADRMIGVQGVLADNDVKFSVLSVGNPHCVIFANDNENFALSSLDLEAMGSAIENDPQFPERTNVEFCHIIDDHTILARVWERGTGETYSCGTGACAVAVAAIENGYCSADKDITVHLKGGDLIISYDKESGDVQMSGETVEVYRGTVEL
ncbi:MAG: carbamoyl-phosphate synthase large subunit [Ruminococcaceae bacterium]|nr:carbamoyl-phosphate synthase large subunit [Oscillospiraceae bacterium]